MGRRKRGGVTGSDREEGGIYESDLLIRTRGKRGYKSI